MKSMLFDKLHNGIGDVLTLRSQQNAITASNIANADTPGYKARFINFENILAEAVDANSDRLTTTHELHFTGMDTDPSDPQVETMEAPPWVLDGNSVELERESVRLKENAMMYRATSKGLSKRLAMMRYAANNGKG